MYFQLSRARDLDVGSGHTAYCRASHTYQISLKSKNPLWMNVRTDGHLRPTLLGRLTRFDLITQLIVDGFWLHSVNVDTFATSTACCDLDLQNLTRSSVGAGGYSLKVSSRLLKWFMRYAVHKIWPWRPALTMTFDLKNIRSSMVAGKCEYSR